jgi:hypothetical protein
MMGDSENVIIKLKFIRSEKDGRIYVRRQRA